MISINNLTVTYSNNFEVISSLCLALQTNQIHGVVGLNGAGKTTLLNAIYGLTKSASGTISYNNRTITKKDIAYLESENFFYRNITALEYLNLFKNKDFDTNQWNKFFNLPLNDLIDTYSTGMKKKLALFGVLKQNKSVTILDEPFNGLDIEACQMVRTVLLRLKERNKTIIVTSHIIETLTNLCDQIHHLDGGKIVASFNKANFHDLEQLLCAQIESRINAQIDAVLPKLS